MAKVMVEIDAKELERIVDSLPQPVKIRLANRWSVSTRTGAWDRLFAKLDRRRRGRRFRMASIVREVKTYRRKHVGG